MPASSRERIPPHSSKPTSDRRRFPRLWLGVGALALTLVVTWPLARCLGRCLGEPPDTLLSVYFLSWVAHSLLTPGITLVDASIFAPYRRTLALGDYMPAYAPVSVPIIAATGNPVLAHNVLLVLSYALAALGAFGLARRLTGCAGPALVAGVAFGYAPRLLDQAYNLETLSVFWFPWFLLALERFLEGPTWPGAALVAGIWLGMSLSSLKIFVFATVLASAFLAVAVTVGRRRIGPAHVFRLAATGAAAAALLLLYLSPNRTLAREWGLGRALDEVERHSATLGDFVTIPREPFLHRLAGLEPAPDHTGLVPGVTVTALAIVGLLAVLRSPDGLRRRWLPYVVPTATAAVLALGPTLSAPWGLLPLPYRLFYAGVPGFDAIRTPGRFLVFVDLGVALLAAAGVAAVAARLPRPARGGVAAGLIVLILSESVLLPFPGAVPRLDPATLPDVYRWLARQDPRTLALGLPMGDWVNVAAAAFHLRPTVNGWSSFEPPLYGALTRAMETFPDERTLALVQGLGVDVILIDRAWLTPARLTALAAFPSALRPEAVFPTHLVVRVPRAPRRGLERLKASAALMPGATGSTRLCVTLRNPGTEFIPFYPLHRVEWGVEGAATRSLRWLPLDLAPGAEDTGCLILGPWPGPLRIRGEVEAPDLVYRFAVSPSGLPESLVPEPRR
jgi:hypothetical protein